MDKLDQLGIFQYTSWETTIAETNQNIDAKIHLRSNLQEWNFNGIIKTQIVPAQIPKLKNQIKEAGSCILIAEYITTQAKDILRVENISYLDTSGNIFIKGEGLYIFVETNKTSRKKLKVGNRAFNKTGLKVIYELLIHPESLNKSYRYIGERSKVSIDTVRRIIQELLHEQYIIQVKEKEYQFVNRRKLFQEWVTAFNRNLRPMLKQTQYKFIEKQGNWKEINLPDKAYWGGAVAAEIAIDYLIANRGIIYTDLPFREIMKELKMVPDEKGNITIVEKFWKTNLQDKIVPYMLIYADLMNEYDPRHTETANKIYEKYVENHL